MIMMNKLVDFTKDFIGVMKGIVNEKICGLSGHEFEIIENKRAIVRHCTKCHYSKYNIKFSQVEPRFYPADKNAKTIPGGDSMNNYKKNILDKLEIKVEKIDEDAKLPRKQHECEDVAYDLYANESAKLYPGDRAIIGTGIKIAIPQGFGGFINPRSGLAIDHGITVLNSDGVIDPGYRAEVGVVLINHGDTDYIVSKGDRVAQLVISQYEDVEFSEVNSLETDTERGKGGFGHTGK